MLLTGLIAPIAAPSTVTGVTTSGGIPQLKLSVEVGLSSRPTFGCSPPLMKPSSPSNCSSISPSLSGVSWHFWCVSCLRHPINSNVTDSVLPDLYSPFATPKAHWTSNFLPTVSSLNSDSWPSKFFFGPSGPGSQSQLPLPPASARHFFPVYSPVWGVFAGMQCPN